MKKTNFDISAEAALAEPAAIIGLACIFPGAENLSAYWDFIKSGRVAIGDIPPDHWQTEDYYDPDPKAADKTYGRRGAFLSPVDFEPLKYGIVPKDLSAIDSTQILGLMAADEALADAGYPAGGGYDHSRTSVLLGVTGALKMVVSLGSRLAHPQLRRALADSGVDPDRAQDVLRRFAAEFVPWQESSFPGLLGNVTAGRIANRLNLGGANLVTDAACASSLAALRQSLMELQSHQADLVVTGGLDTFSDPFMYTCFSKTPALSPRGEVRAYDQSGDGTVLGEGIGVMILKRLTEAQRDGDRIYAVIRSVGASSDGKGAAIFAPSPEGQRRALENAYASAGLSPETVGLIEGHGTGTAVGDNVEVEALKLVFGRAPREPWCALGSVKAQIGHTKAAAGAAGLIKAALALYHKVLPPTAGLSRPLAALNEPGSPFHLSDQARPWLSAGPRRAGVSAFGFGGSNFHAVLEEAEPHKPAAEPDEGFDIFPFSAATYGQLAEALARAAEAGAGAAAEARAKFSAAAEFRLLLVSDRAQFPALARELSAELSSAGLDAERLPEGVFFGQGPARHERCGFLSLGPDEISGGLWSELALAWPQMLEALNRKAAQLAASQPELPALGSCLYPPPLASEDSRRAWAQALAQPSVRQAAAEALHEGLVAVLELFGLRAAADLSAQELRAGALENAQDIDLWLELAPAGSLAPLAAGPGRQVLPLDSGAGGRSLELARLLARLAALGLPVDLRPWPNASAGRSRLAGAEPSFTVKVSGANIFQRPQLPPSALAAPLAPASPELSGANISQRPQLPPSALSAPLAPANPEAPTAKALALLQGLGAETARLHQEFLRQQSEALRLIQASLGLEAASPAQAPLLRQSEARPLIQTALGAKESQPPQTPLWAPSEAPSPIQSALAPETAAAPPAAEAPTDLILQVLAEETGYPLETLQLDLDLEADLGLDSIKKVEIMAAAAERLPEATQFGAESLHSVATVRDLVKLLTGSSPQASLLSGSSADVSEQAYDEPAPARPETAAPAASGDAIWPLLRQVVASETGYPEQMLQPQLHLANDLGLDSIKVVEISSLMTEKIPQSAALNAASLSTAATLGDLAAALAAAPAEAEAAAPQPPEPPAAPAQEAGPASALETVLDIVASETGYPRQMLDLSMRLEEDLGLDSIKKVEIMAAVTERLPGLEELATAEVMAGLQSLGDLAALAEPTAKAVASPAPASGQRDLAELLLDVVAEETGYPRQMLSFDASLEEDLGLDSIKRVEIMAALSEKSGLDSLVAPAADIMGQAQTLGDLRDLLNGREARPLSPAPRRGAGRPSTKTPPQPAASEGDTTPPQTEAVSSFRVEMKPWKLDSLDPPALAAGTRVLIAAEEGPAAQVLEEAFNDLGSSVTVAAWSQALSVAASQRPQHLLLVWPGQSEDLSLAGLAFQILRQASESLKASASGGGAKPLVLGLTFMGGSFAFDGLAPELSPAAASLAGLLKTAAREWPQLRVMTLDLPASAYGPRLKDFNRLMLAAAAAAGPVEVGLSGPQQLASPSLVPYKLRNIRVRHVREGQTIVVTGGARGVTAAALKEVARSLRPKLVILGRTPLGRPEPRWLKDKRDAAAIRQALFERAPADNKPSPQKLAAESARILAQRELRENLAALEKAGSQTIYIAGDFLNEENLAQTMAEIKREHGPICGFIHGAGVLADSLMEDKNEADFKLVFDTKAKLASDILGHLDSEPLNLAAFFSSSTARFGRKGQADYAAGNEVLNKLAQRLAASKPGPKCLSVNWGPWAGGMVDASLRRLFEKEGIGLIPLDEGARLFAALAGSPKNDPVEVVVLGPQTDLSGL